MTNEQIERNFQDMYRRLYWLSYDITGEDEASRDIIQECYSLLWNSHRDISPGDLPAYIFTAVRNAALKRRREQQRRATVPIDMLADDGAMATDDNWQEREAKVRNVEQLIRRLSPKAREMISLRFRQNLSYKDIAERTGTNVESVRKTLYRALKSIRMQINANNVENPSTKADNSTSNNI